MNDMTIKLPPEEQVKGKDLRVLEIDLQDTKDCAKLGEEVAERDRRAESRDWYVFIRNRVLLRTN